MYSLTNPIADNLDPKSLANNVGKIGYEVLIGDETVYLSPTYDCVGIGAAPGETVKVMALGLGVEGVVIRRLKGYRCCYQVDTL